MAVKYVVFDLGSTLVQTPPPSTRKSRRLTYFRDIFTLLRSQGIDTLLPGLETMDPDLFAEGLTAHIEKLKGQGEDWTLKDSILHYIHLYLNRDRSEKRDILTICHVSPLLEEVVRDEGMIDVSGYEVWTDTKETLEELRSRGVGVAVYVNSCSYVKTRKILRETGLAGLIDYIFVSGETQVQAPSREVNTVVLNTLGLAESEVVYVSDMLDRLIKSAQLSNLKAIWLNLNPSYPVFCTQNRNKEAIVNMQYPRTITALSQLISALDHYSPPPSALRCGYYLSQTRKKILFAKVIFTSETVFYVKFQGLVQRHRRQFRPGNTGKIRRNRA